MRWIYLLVGASVYCALAFYYGKGGMIDDAFITFRYAENLANGHGLVFNPGGNPVEGYSNFLWTVLLALCYWFGWQTPAAAFSLGVLSGIGVLLVIYRLLLLMRASSPQIAAAIGLFATAPSVAIYATSGMETLFYTLLLTSFLYFFIREGSAPRLPISGVLAALVCLTRPEGFIVVSVFVLWRIYETFKRTTVSKRNLCIWLGQIAIITIPFIVWRYSFYGYLLPMTVYAKVTSDQGYRGVRQILGGIRYFIDFSRVYGGGIGLSFLLWFASLQIYREWKSTWRKSGEGEREGAVVCSSLFLLWYIFYCINVGGDWMPQFRFYVPFLPVMYVLLASASFASEFNKRVYWLIPAAFIGFNLAQIPLVLNNSIADVDPRIRHNGISFRVDLIEKYTQLGRDYPGVSLATISCGILPYYSGLETIDMIGLNDEYIAMRLHEGRTLGGMSDGVYKKIVDYIFERKPGVIHMDGSLFAHVVYHEILSDAESFLKDYVLDKQYTRDGEKFYVRREILLQ